MNSKSFMINESAFSAEPVISKKNPNTVEFIAVLQEADKPNRNGRIYYKSVLEQALQAPYVQERLRTKSFFCEAGHPTDTSVQRQMTIDQRNIAAIVKEFWWEGNLLKAKVETADTAIGRDMKGLIEQGSRVAFSLRAQGNVHHDPMLNATVVESPIQIATYDWVVNPSHDKAFLESICEDTKCSMFGSNLAPTQLVLAESVNLFESGRVISLNEITKPAEAIDYAKHFGKKVKALSEAYIYSPKDKLTVDGRFAILTNQNATRKTMLEDYLLKDLRHRISKLSEETEAPISGEGVTKAEAEAVKPVEVIDNTGSIVKVHSEDHTKVVDGVVKIQDHDHASKEGAEVRDALHIQETHHKDENEPRTAEEIAKGTHPIHPEVKDGEVKVQSHDLADKEGVEVRGELIQEEKSFKQKFKDALKRHGAKSIKDLKGEDAKKAFFNELDALHVSKEEKASMVKESADELGKKLGIPSAAANTLLTTKSGKTFLDKKLGLGNAEKDKKEQTSTVKEGAELGSAAAEPVATSEAPAKEHAPELDNKDVFPAEEHKQVEEVKEVVVQESELGSAAAEPVATSEAPAKEHTPELDNKDVFPAEEHKQVEEVKEVIIQESKKKLPAALKANTFDDPKDADKVPEKLEKASAKKFKFSIGKKGGK
jgi:hypothetical protein